MSIHFESLGTVWIQNQPVVAGSAKLSREVFDGGNMCATGVISEAGDLASLIGDVL